MFVIPNNFIKDIIKNANEQIKYKNTVTTGEITVDNGDGTYDVKITNANSAFPNVETINYDAVFSVGEIVDIIFEQGCKEAPKIIGHSKKIKQEPKQVEVDYSGEIGGGVQTKTMISYGSATIADGSIYKINADYDVCHAAVTGDLLNNTDDFVAIGYFYDTVDIPPMTLVHAIYRGFIFIDTSTIPVGANITSAILYIYKDVDNSFIDTEFDLIIQDGQPIYPHSVLTLGDYNRENYHNNGGSINTAIINDSAYSPITLNNNGKNWINKGGLTKFCLRSSREIAGLSSGSQPYYEALAIYSFKKGEGYKPKLTITYEI